MDQKIINLYDEYTHKPLSRKEFIKRLSILVGGTAAALSLLPMLESNYAKANAIGIKDDLFTERVKYKGDNCEMQAYIARPKQEGVYSTVIVIHENRGLNAHIEDVARRVAKAGYLAIAPNALSVLPKLPATEDEARAEFSKMDPKQSLNNFSNAFDYAATRNDCNGKFACVGFCWGGAIANNLAVHVSNLKAAVSFYGLQPKSDEVSKIKVAVQLHYASLDERINAGIASYEEALKSNDVEYEMYVYEGVNHAFHNDTAGPRYNEEAAKLAWGRTLEFFGKKLG